MKKKFIIKMDPDAYHEYERLDNSIIEEVDKALESLEERADEVGKVLGKKRQIDLTGSKEKKLRGPGVRIIYTITNEIVEVLRIVVILAVAYKKDETTVYKNAEQRFSRYKKNTNDVNQLNSWSSSTEMVSALSESDEADTFLYYEKKELSNNQYKLRLEAINQVVGEGSSIEEALLNLAINLLDYAKEYIANYNEYYNNLETLPHFRYVIKVITVAGEESDIHKIVELLCER